MGPSTNCSCRAATSVSRASTPRSSLNRHSGCDASCGSPYSLAHPCSSPMHSSARTASSTRSRRAPGIASLPTMSIGSVSRTSDSDGPRSDSGKTRGQSKKWREGNSVSSSRESWSFSSPMSRTDPDQGGDRHNPSGSLDEVTRGALTPPRAHGTIVSSDSVDGAGWSSPVARWAHNPKVAGSNPAPATNFLRADPAP